NPRLLLRPELEEPVRGKGVRGTATLLDPRRDVPQLGDPPREIPDVEVAIRLARLRVARELLPRLLEELPRPVPAAGDGHVVEGGRRLDDPLVEELRARREREPDRLERL